MSCIIGRVGPGRSSGGVSSVRVALSSNEAGHEKWGFLTAEVSIGAGQGREKVVIFRCYITPMVTPATTVRITSQESDFSNK